MIEEHRVTYITPADDARPAILAAIASATRQVRVMDYECNWLAFAQALVARHQAGVDVRAVLDSSEAGTPTERPVLAALKAAGVPFVVGRSEDKRIMHLKAIVIDGQQTDARLVTPGSLAVWQAPIVTTPPPLSVLVAA